MRNFIWLLIPALLSVIAIAAEPPQQDSADHPAWAFPAPDANPPAGAEASGPVKVPGSSKSYTQKEIDDLANPPDWFPDDHAAVPQIVRSGASNKGFACGSCHLFAGYGHPESASLAGLSADFIVQQMADFKSGDRIDPARMNTIAQATSDDDAKAAADYFSMLKPTVWVKVMEADMVPKSWVNQARMRLPHPGGAMEPIGYRIIDCLRIPHAPPRVTLNLASSLTSRPARLPRAKCWPPPAAARRSLAPYATAMDSRASAIFPSSRGNIPSTSPGSSSLSRLERANRRRPSRCRMSSPI